MSTRRSLHVLGAAAAVLTSCAPAAHPGPAAKRPFVVIQQREPRSLNPALENGTSSSQWGLLLFRYLVKYDDRGVLVGDAATETPSLANGGISRDGRTVTYHLRPGLRWSDGKPLTASDCAYSVEAILDPRNSPQTRYGYDRIARAEARDAQTCVLHLKEPFAPILTTVMAPQGYPLLPRHALASSTFDRGTFGEKPVGAGPYVVTSWRRGDRVTLRPNPYYAPAPGIAEMEIRFVPDAGTAKNQLRTGEADMLFNDNDLGDVPQLEAIPGMHTTITPLSSVGALIWNTTDPAVADKRVRRALTSAIDVATMVAKTYHGAVSAHEAGRGLFIWAFDPTRYPDTVYDPAAARRALAAAGFRPGTELTLVIQAGIPGDAVVANTIVQQLSAVGAKVSVKQYSAQQIVAPAGSGGPVYGGKFSLALYGFVNGDDPDTTDQFACANVPPRGYNKSRICDAKVDALLAAGRSTFDTVRRKAIYGELQARIAELDPLILIYRRVDVTTATAALRGMTGSVDTVFWNVAAWRR